MADKYEAVRRDIRAILPRAGYDDGSIAPVLVRCVHYLRRALTHPLR